VAAIHVAGVRGDPCGAVLCTAPQGSPRTDLLPDDDLLRSKQVGVPLSIFMYFNEINIPD